MSIDTPDAPSLAAARDARRWLIGVSISVVFGLFGVAMALLRYMERTTPAAPAGIGVPAKHGQDPAPQRHERRPGDRRK
jgi:hypothetical protein